MKAMGLLLTWWALSKERRSLGSLPERMLRDIGVDRGVANAEAGRPFWDVPRGRRDV